MRGLVAGVIAGLVGVGVGVGVASAQPGKAPSKAPAGPEIVRVYVWERGGLTGLYCTSAKSPSGLSATGCGWPASLSVPVGKTRVTLARRATKRESLDGSTARLDTYRLPASGKRAIPVVVVESPRGLTVWTSTVSKDRGDELLPDAPPVLGEDRAGVARFDTTVTGPSGPGRPVTATLSVAAGKTTHSRVYSSWTDPLPLAAIDIDGDGVPELIVQIAEDDGGRVSVHELDDDFSASVGG